MIISLVIIALFFGGSLTVDFTDPVTVSRFRQNVYNLVEEPARARKVADGVIELGRLNQQLRYGTQRQLDSIVTMSADPNVTAQQLNDAFNQLEALTFEENRKILSAREVMRLNTDKKEWKKLLKYAAEEEGG